MRLKLILDGPDGARDVAVTCDATATVGDVATFLAGRDAESSPTQSLTLWVHPPESAVARTLNPLLSMHDAGVRSGARVALVAPREAVLLEAEAPAILIAKSGPDGGTRFPLAHGVNFIGRDPAAHVRLQDRLVSRRHASITVAGGNLVLSDLNSANGIQVDGERIQQTTLLSHTRGQVGDTEFVVEVRPSRPASADERSFTRSPRVVEPWSAPAVEAPTLPSTPERPPFPWVGIAAPVIAGVALFAITRNPLMLLFIALSPILMLGMWLDQIVRRRRQRKEQTARFESGIAALASDLSASVEQERRARLDEAPSISEVSDAIVTRSPLVWTRLPEHAAFLSVRFGLGTLPSRLNVTMPPRDLGATEEWTRLKSLVDRHTSIVDVPVVERFEDAGAIGIAGRDQFAPDVARAMLLQLAGLHSPAELAICAFLPGGAENQWSWLKWLPHTDAPYNPVPGPLAVGFTPGQRLLERLEELVQSRQGEQRTRRVRSHLSTATPGAPGLWEAVGREPALPNIVVFIAGDPAVDRGRLVQIAKDGPDVGVYTIWLSTEKASLPVVCRTSVEINAAQATVSFVRHGATVNLSRTELVEPPLAERLAKALAPLEDDGALLLDESDLPPSVTLLELYDDDIAGDYRAIAGRWMKNSVTSASGTGVQQPRDLAALVGQAPAGPMRIDLRRDGPHALVGGTTGSGKSEFLQTWILALAAEHSPERLSFLLVDYKGGSAFGECVHLPHAVGLVTDLTPHLVTRALTSLRAELKRREEILAARNAKDLLTLEERGDPDAPPALAIIIDEFAALVTEVPDFVDGVIDIAQRGRSLGLHLVMATQRPAGVIKESLRANTNLRIALRVADEADSQDVLGIDRAAHFDPSTPGRAAAKLGAGRVRDFQAAYVGGRTGQFDSANVDVHDLPLAPGAQWPASVTTQRDTSGPTDIARLVKSTVRAAEALHLPPPRRPWLDALPDSVALEGGAQSDGLRLGLQDEPDRQAQRAFTVDFDAIGNLAVFGTGGSGKTTFLRSLTVAATTSAEPTWIYAVDAGAALTGLEELPNVGAVISLTDDERIGRLINELQAHVARRSRDFAAAGAANLHSYNAARETPLPRILVLIDGMAAFRAAYEFKNAGRVFDAFAQLMTGGREVGVHFVITADRQASMPQSLLTSIQERIILRLASDIDYDLMGVPRDLLVDAPPGRAYARGREIQIATPGGSTDLARQLTAVSELAAAATVVAEPIRRLEETIQITDLPATIDGRPTLGVADDTLEPVGVPDGLFIVSGPFRSGRTTALKTIITNTSKTEVMPSFLIASRPSQLADATAWTQSSADTDEVDDLLAHLIARVTAGELTQAFVVIESSGDFEGTATEATLARLLKLARRTSGLRVIVETDTVNAGSAWQIFAELKSARGGIILQPEESDGTVLRVQFPRVTRSDFPVGRGLLVDSGHVRRIQVALP